MTAELERQRAMQRGLDAFDRGAFFEAHEHWEDVWRITTGPERTWIQGLIQLAAALVKMEKHSFSPCGRLASRAGVKLVDAPSVIDEIDIERAREVARLVMKAADRSHRLDLADVRLGR